MLKKQVISWGMVVLWMGVIFYFSAQVSEASSQLSSGVTQIIVDVIHTINPNLEIDLDTFRFIIRKLAHFTEYFILALFVMNALRSSGICRSSFLIALIICVLYAISDEFHQMFVPGRGPSVRDVFIDSLGAFVGIVCFYFLAKANLKKR